MSLSAVNSPAIPHHDWQERRHHGNQDADAQVKIITSPHVILAAFLREFSFAAGFPHLCLQSRLHFIVIFWLFIFTYLFTLLVNLLDLEHRNFRSWRLVSTLIARCQPRVVVTPEYRYRVQPTHLATFWCNLRTFRFIKT